MCLDVSIKDLYIMNSTVGLCVLRNHIGVILLFHTGQTSLLDSSLQSARECMLYDLFMFGLPVVSNLYFTSPVPEQHMKYSSGGVIPLSSSCNINLHADPMELCGGYICAPHASTYQRLGGHFRVETWLYLGSYQPLYVSSAQVQNVAEQVNRYRQRTLLTQDTMPNSENYPKPGICTAMLSQMPRRGYTHACTIQKPKRIPYPLVEATSATSHQ